MSQPKTSFLNSKWFIAFFTVICSSPVFWDWFKGYKFATTFTAIWNFIKIILMYPVSLWVVTLIVMVLLFVMYLLVTIKQGFIPEPDSFDFDNEVVNYDGDKFGQTTYGWNWRKNPKTNINEPYDIHPLCDTGKCNYLPMTMITNSHTSSEYACTNCNLKLTGLPPMLTVYNTIIANAKKKYPIKKK